MSASGAPLFTLEEVAARNSPERCVLDQGSRQLSAWQRRKHTCCLAVERNKTNLAHTAQQPALLLTCLLACPCIAFLTTTTHRMVSQLQRLDCCGGQGVRCDRVCAHPPR